MTHNRQKALKVEAVGVDKVEATASQFASQHRLKGGAFVQVVNVGPPGQHAPEVVPHEADPRLLLGNREHLRLRQGVRPAIWSAIGLVPTLPLFDQSALIRTQPQT